MTFTDEEKHTDESCGENAAPPQDPASSLDEITRLLRRMLTLAELSASDVDVDRELLQETFERLKGKIDSIADSL